MLILQNISFSFEKKVILRNLTLEIKKGEVVALIGASGCGKTTLFRLIMGLEKMQEGELLINEKAPDLSHTQISYMVQEDLLLPWRTIRKNLELLYELNPFLSNQFQIPLLLKQVGLKGCEDLFPAQLSRGMRQRVSLVRALLQQKSLLLLDEPFGTLDLIIREEIYHLLLTFQKQLQLTIVFTTHDFRDALFLADRIVLLAQGKIVHEWKKGEKEEILRKAMADTYEK